MPSHYITYPGSYYTTLHYTTNYSARQACGSLVHPNNRLIHMIRTQQSNATKTTYSDKMQRKFAENPKKCKSYQLSFRTATTRRQHPSCQYEHYKRPAVDCKCSPMPMHRDNPAKPRSYTANYTQCPTRGVQVFKCTEFK